VLLEVNRIVQQWVVEVSQSKVQLLPLTFSILSWLTFVWQYGLSEEVAKTVGAQVLPFGSYRLGVHTQGSFLTSLCFTLSHIVVAGGDIDTLLCFPRHIQRDEFFKSFYAKLAEHPDVADLHVGKPAMRLDTGGSAYLRVFRACFTQTALQLPLLVLNSCCDHVSRGLMPGSGRSVCTCH
jgi:poly(A) polymerase